MAEPTKLLAVTKLQAELILDSFKVSNNLTRDLALKAAGVVLEFAADDAGQAADRVVREARRAGADEQR